MADNDLLDERMRGRLLWSCRRGLLENDLFIQRFFDKYGATLTERQARGLSALMDLSDNDLMDLLLRRTEPSGDWVTEEVHEVLTLLRQRT